MDDDFIENVNHTTTIGIAAILALAAITPGILAVGTAYAGGHGRSHGHGDDGDSFVVKTLTKQKNLCWSVDNSTTDCENDASVFGSNRNENEGQVTPRLVCIPSSVAGITAVLSGSTCSASGDPNVITGGVCNAIPNSSRTVQGQQNPIATCSFPATPV